MKKAISKTKSSKAAGSSGPIEMLKISGKTGVDLVTIVANSIVSGRSVPLLIVET